MTTRTVFLSGALLTGALLSGPLAPEALVLRGATADAALAARAPEATPNNSRCSDVERTTLARWGTTGDWRALAPYPVPRDASPTAATGVWIERWQLENGRTELRKISAAQTEVVTLDPATCLTGRRTYARQFNTDSLRNALTDSRLDSLLKHNKRGMIYVWSPRMPYSVSGLEQARLAAQQLGIPFTAVVAETNDAELNTLGVSREFTLRMESLELVYRNGTIHYPAALVYHNGVIVDGAYPGYKNVATYVAFAKEQFAAAPARDNWRELSVTDAPRAPQFWVDKKARVTELSSVKTIRRIGFFFKPITGTDLVSYNSANIDYFFNMKTGAEIRVPGYVDPVPTPDGRFLTLPGLAFYRVPALLAGDMTAMQVDRELPDEYQTASILSETKANIRYRVVTGWNAGARFRDYDVAMTKGVPTAITPLAVPFAPCKDRLLTLPISAKSGTEFGAFDAKAKTNLVLEVVDAEHCAVKLDLGFASGKISFSYDGASIALATSRINTTGEGELIRPSEMMFKDALVLHRKTGRIVSLSDNEPIHGMTFPEFLRDGTVMLLDQVGPNRPVESLRVMSYK